MDWVSCLCVSGCVVFVSGCIDRDVVSLLVLILDLESRLPLIIGAVMQVV